MVDRQDYPHLFLHGLARTEAYTKTGGGKKPPPVARERESHAARLLRQLDQARTAAIARRAQAMPTKGGYHLEIEAEPGFELWLPSLDSSGLQLVAVPPARPGEPQRAVVFVPQGKLASLERKIQDYRAKDTKKGKPRHQALVANIAEIRLATLRSFWTDQSPRPDDEESIWWEVWLRAPDEGMWIEFREAATRAGLSVERRSLEFPETRVLLAYGSLKQFSLSIETVDAVAELRRAKESSTFFLDLPSRESLHWVDDVRDRTRPPSPSAPRVCILDTGVNRSHPLLEVAIHPEDLHTVEPSWGTADLHGHGTRMAGLAAYGDLTEILAAVGPVGLNGRLESAKILPLPSDENSPELYGALTEEAVLRVEVTKPRSERRVHLMAVSATDGRDRGRPSSWSAAVDKLAFGELEATKRLWVLSAGNCEDPTAWGAHPDHLATSEVHDPGQAWNALTVGGCTRKWQISEPELQDWRPIAQPDDLNPSTSTSVQWAEQWPLKPDVVFEGGNAARSPDGEVSNTASLALLTTHHRPWERYFVDVGDTSAASAQVAGLAAAIQGRYPEAWPESVRALIVHSARWSSTMLDRYAPQGKLGHRELLRSCGHGIPSLDRALQSAANRLTLVAEDYIQPFKPRLGRDAQLKEINFYRLPWPEHELRELGAMEVRLRVTLSYYIEPNPSERGYFRRHRYASHGLRFDVSAAGERQEEFRKRLNAAAREEGESSPGTGDSSGWSLGPKLRNKGSIHADTWVGTAADLADRRHVAVFPVSGWWKEERSRKRAHGRVRYSLIVSIESPAVEVDLYTPVAAQIGIEIEV